MFCQSNWSIVGFQNGWHAYYCTLLLISKMTDGIYCDKNTEFLVQIQFGVAVLWAACGRKKKKGRERGGRENTNIGKADTFD